MFQFREVMSQVSIKKGDIWDHLVQTFHFTDEEKCP